MAEYDFSDIFPASDEEAMDNPRRRGRKNAGRHVRGQLGGESRKVRGHGAHYGGPASDSAMLAFTKDELVEDGSDEAIAELRRRGRGPDGVKLAWTSGGSAKPAASSSSRASGKGAKGRSSVMSRAAELRAEGYTPREALKMAWAGKNPRRPRDASGMAEMRAIKAAKQAERAARQSVVDARNRKFGDRSAAAMRRATELRAEGYNPRQALKMAWAELK
jgi:hypothetical protein